VSSMDEVFPALEVMGGCQVLSCDSSKRLVPIRIGKDSSCARACWVIDRRENAGGERGVS
jgi:hypothetical protein